MSIDTPHPTGGENHPDRSGSDRPKPTPPPAGDVREAIQRLEKPIPPRESRPPPTATEDNGQSQKPGSDVDRKPATAPRRMHPFGGQHEPELSGPGSDRLANAAPKLDQFRHGFKGDSPKTVFTQLPVNSMTGKHDNKPAPAAGMDVSNLFLSGVFAATAAYKLV
ncbi:hypothetical protein [Nocardia goodfellowii]|uniref:Uncharacterized protein n=1 Tax=Nocardia goodfellowii TaxID=882446 RepID=A0ABS4QJW2_9NOCA|nr:hypothetical protein [Nocardia goodfellowii]MBP2191363.1 hypothetical protein [Nocardia goodfellowii]